MLPLQCSCCLNSAPRVIRDCHARREYTGDGHKNHENQTKNRRNYLQLPREAARQKNQSGCAHCQETGNERPSERISPELCFYHPHLSPPNLFSPFTAQTVRDSKPSFIFTSVVSEGWRISDVPLHQLVRHTFVSYTSLSTF